MSTYNLDGVLDKKEHQKITEQFSCEFKDFSNWAYDLSLKRSTNKLLTEKISSYIGNKKFDFLYKLEYIIDKPLILDYLFYKMFNHYPGSIDTEFIKKYLEHDIMPEISTNDNMFSYEKEN